MILSGKELSSKIKAEIKAEIDSIKAKGKRTPCLVTILVGDDPASKVYVANKEKACNAVGIKNITEILPSYVTTEFLVNSIEEYNKMQIIDGILVQLPLPKHIDVKRVIDAISPDKDVDGFHTSNVANLWLKDECIVPCTPQGIIDLIDSTGVDMTGKNVVVVGRSNIVGLPVAKLCLDRNATVTVAHSKTADLKEVIKSADILIVAIGKAKFITADMIKDDAIVIDVGINRIDSKLYGDVDYENITNASYITPVPGGVGPMTIACLLKNTLKCFKNH